MTLAELIANIRKAQARMSRKNLHRVLFGQCEEVILQLVQRLQAQETALTQPVLGVAEPSRPEMAVHASEAAPTV